MKQYASITAEERLDIVREYRQLLKSIYDLFTLEEIRQVRKAIEMAMGQHPVMRRASGELSIVHSLEVAKLVIDEIGLGKT